MEFFDFLGNPCTASSKASIDALNSFIWKDINYKSQDWPMLNSAAKADPRCPMLLLIRVYFSIIKERPYSIEKYERLVDSIDPPNKREKYWRDLLFSLLSKNPSEAFNKISDLLSEFPKDLVALRLGIVLCIYTGKSSGMTDLITLTLAAESNRKLPEVLSMAAFAYMENDQVETAERYALSALAKNPSNS